MKKIAIPALEPSPNTKLCFFLPGAFFTASSFQEQGFVDIFRRLKPDTAIWILEIHENNYLENTVNRLLSGYFEAAHAQGYVDIELLGVSMGGFGCLSYCRHLYEHHQEDYQEGRQESSLKLPHTTVIAPFLGRRDIIASIAQLEDRLTWAPPAPIAQLEDAQFWQWLLPFCAQGGFTLGLASEDKYIQGHQILAQLLPSHLVHATHGNHDWAAWNRLLTFILQAQHGIRQ